jgi:peptidoglycan/LPS O-acetylase OafA/YrhL
MDTTIRQRNYEIDGIRGWAAVSVVFYHFFWESFGVQYAFIRTGTFSFVLDGTLAVYIFFILSGDALSNSFFVNKSTFPTVRLVVARYFRLTFMVAVSCLVAYFLMKLHLTFSQQMGVIVKREDWFGIFIDFPPDLYQCLRYSLYDVFFRHDVHTSYNPFLWTMSIELLGSMLVFINVFVLNHIKKPLPFLLVQFFIFGYMESWLGLFILGMVLGYLRAEGTLDKFISWKYSWWLSMAAIVAVIVFDMVRNPAVQKSFNEFFIMASCLVAAIYCNSTLRALFRSKLSRFWGEISFPLYAIHFSVLVSYTAWLTILAEQEVQAKNPLVLLIPFSSVILSMGMAFLFYKMEKGFLRWMNRGVESWIVESK